MPEAFYRRGIHTMIQDLRIGAASHESDYARGIRAVVRALWIGVSDYFDAWDMMYTTIRRGITLAWHEGAAEVGIAPDELSPAETQALEQMIVGQLNYVDGFLSAILEGSRARKGKLGPQLKRAKMWANRYADARNRAKTMAGGDQKLIWTLGPTEHCTTCLKLSGKIKRASQWRDANIRPQMSSLACGGYNCQCSLVPTTEPMSKGPLPRIP